MMTKKLNTALKHHERHAIVEATADTVGRLLTSTFSMLGLKESIVTKYEINGETYRMTFEKLPPIQEPAVKRTLKPKK